MAKREHVFRNFYCLKDIRFILFEGDHRLLVRKELIIF